MDIAFRDVGQFEVDDVRDAIDVDAASGNIGCDQRPDLRGLEGGKRLFALTLALVAVDGGDLDANRFKMTRHTVRAALGAREHERTAHRFIGKQFSEQRALLGLFDIDDFLIDAVGGLGDGCHRNLDGVAQQLRCQRTNFMRHGGREKQRLTALRDLGNDLAQGPDEAQIHHLVGFVDDQHFRAVERQRAGRHMVEQTARRGDDDVDAAGECIDLRLHADAAENGDHFQVEVAAIGLEAFSNLGCQFARRRQHEHAGALAHRGLRVGGEAMQNRKRERRRLAGAGLGDAEQVLARHDHGDALGLNGSGGDIAFGCESLQEVRVEAKVCKLSQLSIFLISMPDTGARRQPLEFESGRALSRGGGMAHWMKHGSTVDRSKRAHKRAVKTDPACLGCRCFGSVRGALQEDGRGATWLKLERSLHAMRSADGLPQVEAVVRSMACCSAKVKGGEIGSGHKPTLSQP